MQPGICKLARCGCYHAFEHLPAPACVRGSTLLSVALKGMPLSRANAYTIRELAAMFAKMQKTFEMMGMIISTTAPRPPPYEPCSQA